MDRRRFSLPARLVITPAPLFNLRSSISGSTSTEPAPTETTSPVESRRNSRRKSKLGFLFGRVDELEFEFNCAGVSEETAPETVEARRAPRRSITGNTPTHSRATSSTSSSGSSSGYSTAGTSIYSPSNSFPTPSNHSVPTIISKSPISATFPSISDDPRQSFNPPSTPIRSSNRNSSVPIAPNPENQERRRLSRAAEEREAILALNFYMQSPKTFIPICVESRIAGLEDSVIIVEKNKGSQTGLENKLPLSELPEEEFITLLTPFTSSYSPLTPKQQSQHEFDPLDSPDIQNELENLSIYFTSPPSTRAPSPEVEKPTYRRTQSLNTSLSLASKKSVETLPRTVSYGWI